MIIDGKAIREELKDALAVKAGAIPPEDRPTLFIVMAGANAVTENFVSIKKRFAESLGVSVEQKVFDESATTAILTRAIGDIVARGERGGIVVQLPLPAGVDAQAILNAVPPRYDIDVLGEESMRLFREGALPIFPPVVGAIREILERNSIFLHGKKVAILGQGRLVGIPVAAWFRRMEAEVSVFDSAHPPTTENLQHADIIVSGIGKPGFITPDMVHDGAIVLDAGTSEAGGKIVGDANPSIAGKCALFTPVPGGIGPVTIAILLQNLLTLAML